LIFHEFIAVQSCTVLQIHREILIYIYIYKSTLFLTWILAKTIEVWEYSLELSHIWYIAIGLYNIWMWEILKFSLFWIFCHLKLKKNNWFLAKIARSLNWFWKLPDFLAKTHTFFLLNISLFKTIILAYFEGFPKCPRLFKSDKQFKS